MAITDYYGPLLVRTDAQREDAYGDAETVKGEPREMRGYIGRPSSRQAFHAAKRGVSVDGRLYAPADSGVKAFDVITEEGSGAEWQVVSEPRDAANRGHHIEADLMLLRGGGA